MTISNVFKEKWKWPFGQMAFTNVFNKDIQSSNPPPPLKIYQKKLQMQGFRTRYIYIQREVGKRIVQEHSLILYDQHVYLLVQKHTRQGFHWKHQTPSTLFLPLVACLHYSSLYTVCRTLASAQCLDFYLWFQPPSWPVFAEKFPKETKYCTLH